MPVFTESMNLDEFETGHFGYSGASIEELKNTASKFTLATIVIDASSSTMDFQDAIAEAVKSSVTMLQDLPNADEIVLRVLVFRTVHTELLGFTPIHAVDPDQFADGIKPAGATAGYDAFIDAIEGTFNYSQSLKQNKLLNNAIVIMITDGVTNQGRFHKTISDIPEVRKVVDNAMTCEQLDSLTTILVAVGMQNPRSVAAYESEEAAGMTVREVLTKFHNEAGFSTDLIGVEHSDPGALARVGRFIASSVSSTSQVLGTGGPSTSLSF